MKKKRYNNKFTLVELFVSMAVFLILSLAMMRFLNSAATIWRESEKYNRLYADARIALELISNDLQAVIYDNQDSTQGVYPFWYEAIDFNYFSNPSTSNYAPLGISAELNTSGVALNFINKTEIRDNISQTANVCEIRYLFLPASKNKDSKWLLWHSSGSGSAPTTSAASGVLLRSCTVNFNSDSSSNARYNFADFPLSSHNPLRVNNVFSSTSASIVSNLYNDYSASFDPFRLVIDGVVSCRIVPKIWQDDQFKYLPAIARNSDGDVGIPRNIYTDLEPDISPATVTQSRETGSPLPNCVAIELELMAPNDFANWVAAIDAGDLTQAEKLRKAHSRKFFKTVFMDISK